MTKGEWKKTILGLLAEQLLDMDVDTDLDTDESDLDRIDEVKEELIIEFKRRAAIGKEKADQKGGA